MKSMKKIIARVIFYPLFIVGIVLYLYIMGLERYLPWESSTSVPQLFDKGKYEFFICAPSANTNNETIYIAKDIGTSTVSIDSYSILKYSFHPTILKPFFSLDDCQSTSYRSFKWELFVSSIKYWQKPIHVEREFLGD